jgi:broad specificity phosphatase PhoE
MKLFPLLAGFVAALSACATVREDTPSPPAFYVMRHLEKAEGTDPGLSETGQAKAERLPALLAKDPPAAIYVSTTRRAAETAAPLARKLRIVPKTYNPADTPGLIARVTAEKGNVLVVGHSNTVPDIVERLGGTRPAPLAETDYGDVWRIRGEPRRTDRLRL